MNNPVISPLEALATAIQSHNPFTNAGIVKEQDVWGKGLPDVPTLNAHASDTVFQAIDLVQKSQSAQDKVTSIAITAQQGVGKTHILGRIRHRLERDGSALFVYAGVNNYTDLNLIKYQFQQTLADSLIHTGSQGVMQWQEIATAMANEGFKAININAPSFSPQQLIDRFDKVCASWSEKNKNLMNRLTQEVLKTKLNADPYIVRAILWTLSENQKHFAIKWLSGDELAEFNAEDLGLPNLSKTNQDRESEALKNIQQILNLVSYYQPVVICFDEIDVKNNSTEDGLPTELVIADLVKRLHDTLENSELGKGVVIITVMLPDTWRDKIKNMPGGTPDRLSKYTRRNPIDLKYISGDSLVDLVALWLEQFYGARNLTPPSQLYPFEESNLREFGEGKPTVREALKWCADNFKVDEEILPKEPFERFELVLQREREENIGDYLEDNSLIVNALRFGLETLKGQILEIETEIGETFNEVTIEDITEIEPKSKNFGSINFKIIGKEKDKVFKIGVSVLQQSNGRAVGAGMRRLIDYETFDITRGCLIRSKDKTIRKNWDSYQYLNNLLQDLGGKWVYLESAEVRPIIDLYLAYLKHEQYQLSEEQFIAFSKQVTTKNPLLRKILSEPYREIAPEDTDAEELLNDFINPSSIEDTNDSDDLSELFNEV